VKIEVIRTLDGLLGLRREWERLWGGLPQANPYLIWAWQRAWVEANLDARRLYILAGYEDFMAGLSTKMRQEIRAVKRKLEHATHCGFVQTLAQMIWSPASKSYSR
jgi:hypothetical protein